VVIFIFDWFGLAKVNWYINVVNWSIIKVYGKLIDFNFIVNWSIYFGKVVVRGVQQAQDELKKEAENQLWQEGILR
jgi:hypothetical protein